MRDVAAMVVALSAQLSKFQKDMDDATKIADTSTKRIEDSFKAINPSASGMLKNFSDSATGPAEAAGSSIGTALVAGFTAAIAGIVVKMGAIIDGLAKIGDRATELRLPVNLLQALSVAADGARVSQGDLDKALDHFTETSKKADDSASEFYQALRNIGGGFVTAFKDAPTQEARIRVISNALASTTDEVKKAQLALQTFGTENTRILAVLGEGSANIDRTKEQMKALGLEIDDSAVKKAQEARSNLALLARVFTDQLSSALAEFIPTLATVVPLLESMAAAVRDIFASFREAQNRPVASLQNQLGTLAGEIEKLEQERDKLMSVPPPETTIQKAIEALKGLSVISYEESQRTAGQIDAEIAQLQEQVNAIQEIKRELDRSKATSQVSRQGPAAFTPRAPLIPKAETGKDPFEQQVDSINRHIAALNADAAAVGLTEAAHQGLRTELSLLQAIERSGGEVTQDQIDKYSILRASMTQQQALTASGINLNEQHAATFQSVSDRMLQAAGRADDLKRAYLGVQSAIQFGGNELINIMDALRTKTQTASEAMRNLTNNLLRALEQALLLGSGPLGGLLGTASSKPGGTGGILGALFSSFGTPGKQSGGPVSAGHPYVVGEHGPELFVPQSAGHVMPNAISGGKTAGGTSVEINNYVAADTETKQTRQQGPAGDRIIIDIVKKAQARGELDDVNRGRFGLRPAKVR